MTPGRMCSPLQPINRTEGRRWSSGLQQVVLLHFLIERGTLLLMSLFRLD